MSPQGFARPLLLQCLFCWSGKTTFIKHLLGREYPGIHIGPEPTTDRFVIVDHGLEERRTPGNTLIVQPDKPYQVRVLRHSKTQCVGGCGYLSSLSRPAA